MRTIIACITLLLSFYVVAQNYNEQPARIPPKIELDKSVIECIYQHDIFDEDNDFNSYCQEILQIGKNYVQFRNYGPYRLDSTIMQLKIKTMKQRAYDDLERKYPMRLTPNATLIDLKSKKIIFTDRFEFTGTYCYIEDFVPVSWQLLSGEQTILGYNCKKATTTYRGRTWTVWYAPEIRSGYGPWKLSGLPGLILKAEDATGTHKLEAIGIRKQNNPILKDWYALEAEPLERDHFLKLQKESRMNSLKGMWEAYEADPTTHNKPAFKHFPYIPYELE